MTDAPPPFPSSWQAIQEEVLHRIHTRRWPPGELIPNEAILAEEFGCARATVNRALRGLAEAGFLDRRRKAGTRVAVNPVRKATLEIPVISHDIEARGGVYDYRLLSRAIEPAPADVCDHLRLPRGGPLLHVRALHLSDGQAFAYEDRWANPAAVPDLLGVDLTKVSANEWLVQNAPYTTGEMAMTALVADPPTADILGCAAGAALFVIERVTWLHDVAITWVRLVHRPGHRLRTPL